MCGRTSRSGCLHCEFLDILQFGKFLDIMQPDEEKIIFIRTTNKLLCMLELYFLVVTLYVSISQPPF